MGVKINIVQKQEDAAVVSSAPGAKIKQEELDEFLAVLSDPQVYRDPKRLAEFFSDDALIVCEFPGKIASKKEHIFTKGRFIHFLDQWREAMLGYSVVRKSRQEIVGKDGNAYVTSQAEETFGMFGVGLVQPIEEHAAIQRDGQGRLRITNYEVFLR